MSSFLSGIPAENAARLVAAKPQLEVTQNGNDVVVKTVAGDKSFTNTINLGQESKATLPGGIEYTVSRIIWFTLAWYRPDERRSQPRLSGCVQL